MKEISKIMDKHLSECFNTHGKTIAIEYRGYILRAIKESVNLYSYRRSGLKDKNGVEICAGDFLKVPYEADGEKGHSLLPVLFKDGSFVVDCSFKKDGSYLIELKEYNKDGEIVSNIKTK